MMDGGGIIRHPWDAPPPEGTATEVAPGVLWLRLPLPMVLDHVNIYALDEGDSWTIVDTGIHSRRAVALWETILAGPLQGKPVSRVILTHHHPDHIGMAGWLMERFDAALWASRTSWLMARMLILDVEERPTKQALEFSRAGGMDPDVFDRRAQERPYNFADTCAPIPVGYTRVTDGAVIRAGGRDWDVRFGGGHAPDHLTLWSRDDGLVIAGDQILPGISPNIGVYPTEPEADPLADWLADPATRARMDYAAVLAPWEDAFGAQVLEVKRYPHDMPLIAGFLRAIEAPTPAMVLPGRDLRVNESLADNALLAALECRGLPPELPNLDQPARDRLLDNFADSNETVRARYFPENRTLFGLD